MPANILAIPHKCSRSLSSHLSKAIRTYIAEHYTDTHPDAFADDIKHYVKLRDECCKLEVHKSCVDLASR
jgi:programmed cell death 6-interacting protein